MGRNTINTLIRILGLNITLVFVAFPALALETELKRIETLHENRIAHLHELFGKNTLNKKQFKQTKNFVLDEGHMLPFILNALPSSHKQFAESITEQILESSIKHKLDPVFLIAVILTESSFNPVATGTSGEIGLMQLMPATAKWIAAKHSISLRNSSELNNPIKNIEIGAAYVGYLKNKFESHARLYISAYNMGPKNVKKALRKSIVPKDYAKRIMNNYKDLYAHLNEITYDSSRMPASLR